MRGWVDAYMRSTSALRASPAWRAGGHASTFFSKKTNPPEPIFSLFSFCYRMADRCCAIWKKTAEIRLVQKDEKRKKNEKGQRKTRTGCVETSEY
jgi:hypothetical protein